MLGIAEKNTNSISNRIVSTFIVGNTYSVSEIENIIEYKPGGAHLKGVLGGGNTDFICLKITFEKVENMNQDYYDHIYRSTLFWSSQRNRRFAEKLVCDGKHDVFIFIRVNFNSDFLYYGRAIPIRVWNSTTDGIPSNVVFDMPEYAASSWYKNSLDYQISYDQIVFRNESLKLWNYRASVGKADNSSYLITRHIKPIMESTKIEINDPSNSLSLTPTIDNLFYRGIISFSDTSGKILLPPNVEVRSGLEKFHITSDLSLNNLPYGTEKYLEYHKNYIFSFRNCNNDWMYK